MKTIKLLTGICFALALTISALAAGPAGQFKISAQKKTIDKDKSASQELPRGSTRLEQKKIVYQFEIRNQSTAYADHELKVRWVVLLEGALGRTRMVAPGEKMVVLPFGRPVVVETDEILQSERTWEGPAGRSGEVGETIRGYGLQILAPDGDVLLDTCEPASVSEDVDWAALDKKQEAGQEKPPLPARRKRMEMRRDQNLSPGL